MPNRMDPRNSMSRIEPQINVRMDPRNSMSRIEPQIEVTYDSTTATNVAADAEKSRETTNKQTALDNKLKNEVFVAKWVFAIFLIILVLIGMFGPKPKGPHGHSVTRIPIFHQSESSLKTVPFSFRKKSCDPALDFDTKKFHSKITKEKTVSYTHVDPAGGKHKNSAIFTWVYVCNYKDVLDAIHHAKHEATAEKVQCVAKFCGIFAADCEDQDDVTTCKSRADVCGAIGDPYDPNDVTVSKARWRNFLENDDRYKDQVEEFTISNDSFYRKEEI